MRKRDQAHHNKTCSRREFIRRATTASVWAALAGSSSRLWGHPLIPSGSFWSDGAPHGDPADREPDRPAVRANTPPATSTVVQIVSGKIIPLRTVQRPFLKDGLIQGLCRLTGEADVRDAWHTFLKPDDVILIKFNQAGAREIGTTSAMAQELIESLLAAGWPPEQIMALEACSENRVLKKIKAADLRWQGTEVDFGSCGKDSFLAALAEATAIINVPFLKTHHLATMTGCLKNLSHGMIRHPARFHANGCDPAIAEIVSSPAIRGKMRLHITNALRVVFQGGPKVTEDSLHSMGTLLFSTDPVAGDAVGFGVLNEARSLHNLGPLMSDARAPRTLATAARLGLGQVDRDRIDLKRVDL